MAKVYKNFTDNMNKFKKQNKTNKKTKTKNQDLSLKDQHALLVDEINQYYLLLAWCNIVKYYTLAEKNGYLEASILFNLHCRF